MIDAIGQAVGDMMMSCLIRVSLIGALIGGIICIIIDNIL